MDRLVRRSLRTAVASDRTVGFGRVALLPAGILLALAAAGGCARRVPTADAVRPETETAVRAEEVPEDSVAVGYGSVPRRAVTGAVASLDERDLGTMRANRVEDLLVGRVAGLEVQRTSTGGFRLRVRGATSFHASTEPLLVIDGMPVAGGAASGALDGLQPSDISRVSVLKDAEAAIYGSQGAHGVVLITTKRGKRRPNPQ